MTSKREAILAAIATTLKAAPAIGDTVERSRLVAFSRADGLAVWVEPVQDAPSQQAIPMLDWTMIVRVGVIARGMVPDQVADPALVLIHARLMADLTLGGLAYDVQPRSTAWQLIDADGGAAAITCEFAVLYRTNLQSIEGP